METIVAVDISFPMWGIMAEAISRAVDLHDRDISSRIGTDYRAI